MYIVPFLGGEGGGGGGGGASVILSSRHRARVKCRNSAGKLRKLSSRGWCKHSFFAEGGFMFGLKPAK